MSAVHGPVSAPAYRVIGGSSVAVDVDALWDVGLALQRIRDSAQDLCGFLRAAAAELTDAAVSAELAEVFTAWRLVTDGLADSWTGLVVQTDSLVGVLDTTMIRLRQTIEAYVAREGANVDRLTAADRADRLA
jgi:hypothetical protein